jgi:hypothetical protein
LVPDISGQFLKIQSFVLMGTSKRGNLCWNTASVDPRVAGLRKASEATRPPALNTFENISMASGIELCCTMVFSWFAQVFFKK